MIDIIIDIITNIKIVINHQYHHYLSFIILSLGFTNQAVMVEWGGGEDLVPVEYPSIGTFSEGTAATTGGAPLST